MSQTLPTVLVVDDEKQSRARLRRAIERDVRVLEANRGVEALEVLRREPGVAVILVDQYMPGLSGSSLLRQLRDLHPEVVGVLMTQPGHRPTLELDGQFRIHDKGAGDEELRLLVRDALRSFDLSRRNRDLSRALDSTIVGIAHQLNTPLGVIRGSASLLEDALTGSGAARLREALGPAADDVLLAASVISNHVGRAHALIERLRWISRRQLSSSGRALDLVEAIRDIVRGFACKAFDIEVTDALVSDRTWHGDPLLLSEVLKNLLENARHAYPGTTRGRVEVRVENEGGAACGAFSITVRDSGRGIGPDVLPHVFDPFSSGLSGRGAGLGLPIVRNVVTEKLGGSVRIDSALGRGTAVKVALPRTTLRGVAAAAAA